MSIPVRRLLWYLMYAGLSALLGAVNGPPARADSSRLVFAAQTDSDQTLDDVTAITVIVDGMMKSRSGAT